MVAVFRKFDVTEPMVFHDSGDNGALLLCARELSDVARMQRLLADSDYHYQSAGKGPGQSPEGSFFAVIICHREYGCGLQVPVSDWGSARVIVVSNNCEEELVVSSLVSGANYFFNAQDSDVVLSARIQAALRQHGRVSRKPMALGDIRFDVQKRKVSRAGRDIDLSPKEFDFAYYLFSNRDRIVGNDELMTSVWSLPTDMDTRRIDTAACRVRKKLNLFYGQGWELKRIRRVGYRLDQLVEQDQIENLEALPVAANRLYGVNNSTRAGQRMTSEKSLELNGC